MEKPQGTVDSSLESVEQLKAAIMRNVETINGRIQAQTERLDTMSPEKLALVAEMLADANGAFDRMAATDKWFEMLKNQ